jgi:hypothetical protein
MRIRAASRLPRLAALAAFFAATAPAEATLLVYEPFDYPEDTVLHMEPAAAQNLTGDYTGGPTAIQRLFTPVPGLDYGNLAGGPEPEGQRLSQESGTSSGTAMVSVADDVLVNPGDTIYWSALMTLDDSTNGNRFASITFTDTATGDDIGFGESVVGSGAIRVTAFTAATGQLVAAGEDNAFVDGHTVLLVGRYVNSAAADGDRLDLLVYDTEDADPLTGFDLLDPGAEFVFSLEDLDVDLVRIDQITFEIRGTNNNFIDELRVGTTYADVVPEPASAVLLVGGLCALASVRRRAAWAPGSETNSRAPS